MSHRPITRTHPSVMHVGAPAPTIARSYPCGFADLDASAPGNGALSAGAVFTITGDFGSGRTSTLLRTATEVLTGPDQAPLVLLAVVEDSPVTVLQRLADQSGVDSDTLAARVRVAQVSSTAQLVSFVADVATAHLRVPLVLLVDDFGLLEADQRGSDRTLGALARGDLAGAVHAATGMSWSQFGWSSRIAMLAEPVAVAVTVRVRAGANSRLPGNLAVLSAHVVSADGHVAKSRTPVRPYFVAPDGYDEPTIWRHTDREPQVVLRRCDLPVDSRDTWPDLVARITGTAVN